MPPEYPAQQLSAFARIAADVQNSVQRDYETFAADGLPSSIESFLEDRYGLNLESEYAGYTIKNPWGKASGQLSMTARQVQEDVDAGLGFVVLKTVIAQDVSGLQSMQAWAQKQSRMVVEPIVGCSGEKGWTVSWKGRGWWQSFEEYLQLIRDARGIANDCDTLIVPSCKYHLPASAEEQWRTEEYEYTTQQLMAAWHASAQSRFDEMPLEKDFSPTLAGSDHASAKTNILRWLRTVGKLIHQAAPPVNDASRRPVRLGIKLFNTLFDDDFQLEMLKAIHEPGPGRPDFFVYGNRLFDPTREFDGHRGIAYGGPDLSDRNLRIMSRFQTEGSHADGSRPLLPWSATGNINSGKMALEYALLGASSFQLHTFFQLPSNQYSAKVGSKIQKALLELYFHPQNGFIVWMHHLASVLNLSTRPIRFRDVIGAVKRLPSRDNAITETHLDRSQRK